MAKPQLILHFHAEETHSPLAAAARRMAGLAPSIAGAPREEANHKTLAAVVKLSNRLGAPVLLSMSAERLLRALSSPSARKVLSDGVARGRLLPTPFPAFSTASGLLSPVEMSDELRLNIDLWTMGLITPPFAHADAFPRVDVREADPVARLADLPSAGQTVVLGVDLTVLDANGDGPAVIERLGRALAEYKPREIGKPVTVQRSDVDSMLRRILSQGDRFQGFGSGNTGDSAASETTPVDAGYRPGQDGFPFELAYRACSMQFASRSLSGSISALVEAQFDPARLADPKIGRGALVRGLARSRGPAVEALSQASDSFAIALALLESARAELATDAAVDPTTLALAASIPATLERWLAERGDSVSAECLAEAKKLKTRAVRAAPKPGAELTQAAFFVEIEKACRAGAECLALLVEGMTTNRRSAVVIPKGRSAPVAAAAADEPAQAQASEG